MLAALMMTVACTQVELAEPEQERGSDRNQEKVFVSIEDDQTRVQLNSKVQTVWTRGDQIMTFHPGVDVYWWSFNGDTGDRSGELTPVSYGSLSNDPGFDTHYAIYPPEKFAGIGKAGGIPAVFLNFPATQTYTKDSYEPGSNALVAVSDDPYNFKFHNTASFLRLNLVGTKAVSEITLKGNNDEILAGEFYFVISNLVKCYWYSVESYEMKLICDNVQLSQTPTAFYMSLMPATFERGFTVTIRFADGTQIEKSTSHRVEMERNTVLPMATVDTDNINWQTIEVEHSAETFMTPLFSGRSSLNGYIYWGDGNSMPLIDASESHTYWDSRSTHTVMVRCENQESVEFPSLKGVTEINFSNF